MGLLGQSGDSLHGNSDCEEFNVAVCRFWDSYYSRARDLQKDMEGDYTVPFRNRNLLTTTSEHVLILEKYWANALADKLGVDRASVGKRTIKFNAHASKSFDVCYPLIGEPKILISVKSMQNAYRNLTNRVEEAFGDTAVLRLYRSKAVFGFYFSIVDGPVARGIAEQGKPEVRDAKSGKKPIPPFIALIEDGGDFFDLSNSDAYRKEGSRISRGRQDSIQKTEQRLIDLCAESPSEVPAIHYDAIAFSPVTLSNGGTIDTPQWGVDLSPVDTRLDVGRFLDRLVEVAKLRSLL